jgi:hypothetical protein
VHAGKTRRKSIRFPLQAPVIFWWTNEFGKRQQAEGRSRDISEAGTFVFAANFPPLGAIVGLKIDLRALPNAKGAPLIEYEGQVVRVERPNGDKTDGFAVLRRTL